MNYLYHLYLSGNDPDLITGNFMGDFVKGRLDDRYPPRLSRGIALHRSIDSFAQKDETFNRSRLRIDPSFGLYRGILVDLFYDHFLSVSWTQWSREPLFDYLDRVRVLIEERRELLPGRLQQIVPIIFEDMIPSYLDPAGVGKALERMSRRIARANPLALGGVELVRNYEALREDFLDFMPAVKGFVAKQLDE